MINMGEEKTSKEPISEMEEVTGGAKITVELPGVSQDGIKMEVAGKIVRIDAEGSRGRFETIQALNFEPDPERVSVSFSQGVLEILLLSRSAPPVDFPETLAKDGPEKSDEESLARLQSDLDRVTAELNGMSEERAFLHGKILILQKDFANLRRRHEDEKNILAEAKVEEIAVSLIDVLDNFERARSSIEAARSGSPALEPFVKGMGMIESRICSVFQRLGIAPIESVGCLFDPAFHMSVDSVSDTSKNDLEIVEEKLKGYLYKDKVLRPAHVVVNRTDVANVQKTKRKDKNR